MGLSTDLLSIQRDVAEAKSLAASQRRDDLGAVAAGMEAVLNQVNQSASARPNDPLTLANQLHQLSAELDKAMTNMRATRERSRAASQNLDRTMRSAYAAVNGARSYINNRRAAVGPMTLTAVSEAERHLDVYKRQEELLFDAAMPPPTPAPTPPPTRAASRAAVSTTPAP